MPRWYRPTKTQEDVLHPVSIDFFAFPKFRDILTKHPTPYLAKPRELERAFTEHLTMQWPRLKPIFVTDDQGQPIRLVDDLEPHVFDYDNWAMQDPWLDAYPEYRHTVNHCR